VSAVVDCVVGDSRRGKELAKTPRRRLDRRSSDREHILLSLFGGLISHLQAAMGRDRQLIVYNQLAMRFSRVPVLIALRENTGRPVSDLTPQTVFLTFSLFNYQFDWPLLKFLD